MVAGAVVAVGGCSRGEQNNATTQDMSIDDNLTSSGADTNAQIETLPPDESSTTSSGELNDGDDGADVNGLGNEE
jgi:hypothetical protein